MDSNLKIVLAEYEEFKGQFVITESWNIERFIGIGTDDEDYYYITYDGRKTKWNTCVGSLIKLKGKLDDKDYKSFIRTAVLNHFDQADAWGRIEEDIIKHKQELTTLRDNDKFLTEICWDLN